jgi:hypothetical protein
MTLRCQCGGRVEIIDGSDPNAGEPHFEKYECIECGRRGSYTFENGQETMTGCLTSVREVRP